MTLKKGVITQNEGVMDPFLKGPGKFNQATHQKDAYPPQAADIKLCSELRRSGRASRTAHGPQQSR